MSITREAYFLWIYTAMDNIRGDTNDLCLQDDKMLCAIAVRLRLQVFELLAFDFVLIIPDRR